MKKPLILCALFACALSAAIAFAQTYPTRAIRFVVPTAPGGGPDVVARFIAPRLTELLGQQVVVENRAGANAMIGAEMVARAPADGYTWLFGTGQNTVNPSTMKKVPHDIVADFAPVSLVYMSSFILVVHPAVPAKSVKEFIAVAKAQPNKLNFGSGGIGSAAHLSGELFMMMTGCKMTHIPYKGAGPALQDLIGGQVHVLFDNLPSSIGHIKGGRLRALAVTSAERDPALPDTPTVGDTVPGYEATAWFGIGMPKGTPRDVIEKLNAEVNRALADPKMKEKLAELGGRTIPGTPEDFGKVMAEETARWEKVVKASGAKVE